MATNTGSCAKCGNSNPYSETVCLACGARLPWADVVQRPAVLPAHAPARSEQSLLLPIIGIVMLAGGFAGALYFLLFFDVSVAIPHSTIMGISIGGGRVVNLDLMSQRQNGIMFGMGAAVLGALILGYVGLHSRLSGDDDVESPFVTHGKPLALTGFMVAAGVMILLKVLTTGNGAFSTDDAALRAGFSAAASQIQTTE